MKMSQICALVNNQFAEMSYLSLWYAYSLRANCRGL